MRKKHNSSNEGSRRSSLWSDLLATSRCTYPFTWSKSSRLWRMQRKWWRSFVKCEGLWEILWRIGENIECYVYDGWQNRGYWIEPNILIGGDIHTVLESLTNEIHSLLFRWELVQICWEFRIEKASCWLNERISTGSQRCLPSWLVMKPCLVL
jgi:hypothetical protein